MNRILVIFFLIVFTVPVEAQNLNKLKKLTPSFVFGGNYSKLHVLGEKRDAALRPFLGIGSEFKLNNRVYLEGVLTYSSRASYFTNSIILEERGVDFIISPMLKYDDFFFKAGLSFENPSRSYLKSKTKTAQTVGDVEVETESRINTFIGAEFKLNESFNLFVNHTIPLGSKSDGNLILGLKFSLNKNVNKQPTYRRKRRKAAVKQIKNLKDGTLLIRLKTSQNKINALNKVGLTEEAKKVEENQREQNLKLMAAFKRHYNFSAVQFFYSNYSANVKSGNLEGIFLNDSLEQDSTIKVENVNVFTAEHTKIEQDTLKQFSHSEERPTGSFRTERVDYFFGAPNMDFMALVIKDQQFQQMTRPFPYYARFNKPYLLKHPEQIIFGFPLIYLLANPSYGYMVEAINHRLTRFYNKKTRIVND